MKNGGVFLGGLLGLLLGNLMLIGVCSSGMPQPSPASPPPPPPPPPPRIVRTEAKPVESDVAPLPLGTFWWGCGPHLMMDLEGVEALPICLPLKRL